MSALAEIRTRFQSVLAELTDDVDTALGMIRPSQDPKFGDFQANCAMPLAKKAGKNPRELAQQIVDGLQLDDLCEAPEIAGPGFINLRLRTEWLQQTAQSLVTDDRLGHVAAESRNYVIDYSSPNVAKPMHVGHLRSSVIGAALENILRFAGHKVISDNHIGDWGTQFGMIIYGYRNFADADAYAADPVTELARMYRLVNQITEYHAAVKRIPELQSKIEVQQCEITDLEQSDDEPKKKKKALKKMRGKLKEMVEELEGVPDSDGNRSGGLCDKVAAVESSPVLTQIAENHPDIARLARLETAKLHAGDEDNRRLWDEFLPECLKALDHVYEKLGVSFDQTLGESFYQPMLASVVEGLTEAGLAKESDGAKCVFIDGNEAPFIVQKTDGAFTYATTDLATIRYRIEEFAADAMLYVVDTRQSEHFKLLFETARKWGYEQAEFQHVNFGTVLGEDGRPFKTRSGDTVGLESLLDEAVVRAYEVVVENDRAGNLDEETRRSVAEAVGIGGIKYADLHHNRESDYTFLWDKMLAKNGDTAAYIQYANARINGIFRKSGVDREAHRIGETLIQLNEPAERALALQLQSFGEVVDSAISEMRPNLLTQFLFETANTLSTFYDQCPVLLYPDTKEPVPAELRDPRLLLCDLTGRVLTQGLSLLGIDAPEIM